MFGELLQQVAGLFPRRFMFNALLPTLVFGSVTAAILISCLTSLSTVSAWWMTLDTISKIVVILGYLGGIWFLASGVSSQWRGIVRLFEGYPIRSMWRAFGRDAPGMRWHREHMADLLGQGDKGQLLYTRYPYEEEKKGVLPTRLGNILLAGESYPRSRYGIDPVIFWPRMWLLLSEQFQRDYEEFMMNHEFPLVVSFQAATATTVSAAALLATQQPPAFFITVVLVGFAIAYGAYAFSLSAAEELAEQQRTAFDLYAHRLLDVWPTVHDVEDEKSAFEAIRQFIVLSAPATWEHAQSRHTARRASREESGAGVGADPDDGDATGAPGT